MLLGKEEEKLESSTGEVQEGSQRNIQYGKIKSKSGIYRQADVPIL